MATEQRELNITLTPNTKANVNKLVFEPIFRSDELSGIRVMSGVSNKKKLGYMRRMKKILQKDTGCKWNPKGSADVYTRQIEVEPIKINVEMCADEFKDTVLEDLYQKTGVARNDLTGTQLGAAMILLVRDAIPEDCKNLFWFGKKNSDNEFYNIMDGMWSVYLQQLALNNLSPYVNTGSGNPLDAGDAEAILEKMYEAQSNALKGLSKSEKRFYVTDSVWEGWFKDSADLGGGDAGRFQIINGQEKLTYRGIELVNNPNWDEIMEDDFGKVDSHLALLTTPDNLVMATNVLGDKNRVEFWHDRKTEENDLKVKFKLGANFVHPAFFVIGF
jgi:hypothetical protein